MTHRHTNRTGFSKLNPTLELSLQNPGRFVLTDPDFRYTVPQGVDFPIDVIQPEVPMETDLVSIPKAFRIFFSTHSDATPAALAHDWCYSWACALIGLGFTPPYTRKQADWLFLIGMKELGVSRWKRRLFYRAVRIGSRW